MKKRRTKGTGSVFERDGVWYAELRFKGRRHLWSSGSDRKSDAVKLLDKRRREILDGLYRVGTVEATLRDLRDLMVAKVEADGLVYAPLVARAFRHLERILGRDMMADQIPAHLDRYVRTRLAEKVGKRTERKIGKAVVNRELAILRRAFHLAVKAKRVAVVPVIDLLQGENVRTRFPSEKEIGDVIDALDDRLQEPFRFIAWTGWRVMEVLNLAWRNVDRRAGLIRLEATETKGKSVRVLPYGQDPRLAELIERRYRETEKYQREHGVILESVFWYLEDGAAVPNQTYARAWARACRDAKVADLHVHDMRRAYARRAVRAGIDEMTIMQLAGWKSRSVFDRYSIRDTQDLEDGVRKLAHAAEGELRAHEA